MTKAYRNFLERSQHFLRRIFRKPAWEFNRFVADPRQEKGRRWPCATFDAGVTVWVFNEPREFACGGDDD